ncbi:hypothetical protein [Chitinophaga sp. sic0106]|uniref:hypothetical protein n=1 Tax=Chitinophaga sp. sic0106 TaxID=2854785 RepID=UPI001C470CAB|nr:hypothetical protein [Chitinophaga sp. sic0106]MBV7530982.1 hypothetical protein [Chitinophaga sp. sic0106]
MNNIRNLLYILLLTSMATQRLQGQVVISAQVPPTGILQQSQLWNILLTNAGKKPAYIKVVMRLTDANTGQGVMTAISRFLEVPTGGSVLHLADFQPIATEYLRPTADQRENALLLPGKYIVCYSVVVTDYKSGVPVSEDCLRFVVEPVSPPILHLPADKDTLQTTLPAFTWIPPAPLNIYSDLNYQITVAAVMPGQAPAAAIQQNIPVYHGSFIRQPFMNYPAGAPPLDTGITYAWMVDALNGNQFSSQTEVHTFRVSKPIPVPANDLSAFVGLSLNGDAKPLLAESTLKCAYTNESGETSVDYEIVALQQGNQLVTRGRLTMQPGPNLITIPLKRIVGLSAGSLYAFRFKNSRNENWELKFIFKAER